LAVAWGFILAEGVGAGVVLGEQRLCFLLVFVFVPFVNLRKGYAFTGFREQLILCLYNT